jgi:hypothetical protein
MKTLFISILLFACTSAYSQNSVHFCGKDSLVTLAHLKQCKKLAYKDDDNKVILSFEITLLYTTGAATMFACKGNLLSNEFLAHIQQKSTARMFYISLSKVKDKTTGKLMPPETKDIIFRIQPD